jgi:glycosyltransferase involved in cell wall biosynthesis
MLRQLERLGARVTAKIICVSEFDRELGLKFRIASPEQLVVIHNGMPPEPYQKAKKVGLPCLLEQDTNQGPVFITVGRLAPPKDFETLFKTLQKLDHGKTIVVGDGPYRPRVEKFINQNGLSQKIYLLGERENVPDLLASSEIFVLSSKKEGLPRTIIEAMLSGLPVVATRVGGIPELVEDGVTGFLVPRGNFEAFAKALNRLTEDPDLRRAMGEAGRKKALLEFTLDRMHKQTLRVYEEVLH